MKIAGNILELLGNTPLIALDRLRHPEGARVVAKAEMFNPGSSVKDRIARGLIRAGEDNGQLQPGGTIVEPTSGNTGLGLAMAASLLGYQMICTLPDKVPKEKMDLLRAYGAKVVVCPTNVEADDPRSYYKVAEKLRDEGAYLPYQYYNQANPEAHVQTTGPEIWRDTDGQVTHFVAGMGTGGTISGIGKYLHDKGNVHVTAVDTVGSIYAYYFKHKKFPPKEDIHQYLIQGIGEDLLPDTVWWDSIDAVTTVTDEDAFMMQARLAREEAIFSGSSAGAAVHAAIELAKSLPENQLVVTLLPDAGERYLSTFTPEYMEANGMQNVANYLRGDA